MDRKPKRSILIIRRAKQKDLPAIVELIANDELGRLRENFKTPLPEQYLNAFDKVNADQNQELMVMLNETGDVIGTLQLSFIQYLTYQGGIRAQIEAVRVHENYRNKGIGQELIKWAIDRAEERGAHVVQLTTDKKRDAAVKFYEKLGFIASHKGMKLHLL
ncbi:GNAT family N-acetyltransferase [uncultured Eudoraea sp.]|uniref:GNAT family N-acetyltransferase n=1 Tax=uncultured Eudoraea sp. TaxID=1035614 RepID=UPI002605C859|nr:GNAT family N-acetyltransferase [uncultured Eudoraea sp.]